MMCPMRAGAGLLSLSLICSNIAFGQESKSEGSQETTRILQTAISTGVKESKPDQPSVEACWESWKKAQGLVDGKNDRSGHLLLVSHQQESVNEEAGAKNWLAARRAAFQVAELNARADLANTMKTEISSSRSAAQQLLGGDDAAPSLETPVKQLSIADKANVLVDKALDHEISQYDSTWNPNATKEQKAEKIATLQARVQENIAAHSELFAAGAFTVAECEGRSTEDDGKYSVLIGMIWSAKLAKVAESIWNPAMKLPAEAPQSSLADQFSAFYKESPDWLAYTMGARVFTNEKGERVIVGFGVAPQSTMMSVDKRRASLEALAAIQHFVGEKVEAKAEAADSFERRDLQTGDQQSFDTSSFSNKVAARSQDLQLKGAAEVLSWRGSHPWSNSKMQVVAMAWTPSWSADSEQAATMMHEIERRMNGEGAVPVTKTNAKGHAKGAGSAAPTHSGASSGTHDF